MTARVDAVVYFRVEDPVKAIILAENYFDSTFRISQSTLRDVLGTKSLSEILSDREAISDHMSVSNLHEESLQELLYCSTIKICVKLFKLQ